MHGARANHVTLLYYIVMISNMRGTYMESISFCTQVTMCIYLYRPKVIAATAPPPRRRQTIVARVYSISLSLPVAFCDMPLSRLLHCVFTTPCPPQTTRRPVHRDSEGFPHYHLASLPLASRLRCTLLPIASCGFA